MNQVQFKHKIESAYLASLGDVVFVTKSLCSKGRTLVNTFSTYDMAALPLQVIQRRRERSEYTFELVDWNLN